MSELEINTIRDPGSLRRFIEFPYRHYGHDPYWVPPLRIAQRELLDRAKHPFYRNAEAEFFLAIEDGEVVGRIAAILDRTQFEPEKLGSFGFFESVNSPRVAAALVDAARSWLRQRGVLVFRGPLNPSTNYECG
ncbi:MAG: hypothetical protein NTY38_20255, partial [Acidobacteria bacterium]|nr:hypothetical protein [Acidobacteriota bacterium]